VDNQPVIVEGSAIVEAHVRVPGTNKLIPFFSPDVVFVKAIIEESVDDFVTWEITVQTASRLLVDNFLKNAAAGATPQIRVRLGIGNPAKEMAWLPWQDLIVRQPTSKAIGLSNAAGYFTTVTASDLLWESKRIKRVMARKGMISNIVQEIADFYNFPAVVEPTKYEGLWYQSYVSDYEFITDRMLVRALNDKGRGNYKFFMRDNVLHFHTIDYQTSIKSFNYNITPTTALIFSDDSQEALRIGAGGVRYVVHDQYSGLMQELYENRSNVLVLGNEAPQLFNLKGAEQSVMYHVGSNRIPEALAMANSHYETAKNQAFRAELTLEQSTFFRAGDIVNLVVNPSKSQTTPTSGYYYTPRVAHVVNKASLTSTIFFERGEWQNATANQSALVQSGENLIVTPNAIQGQQLNLNAAQSSQITKGAGNEASRKRFLDAINPSTAPN
jgi:hypothetical protein